MADWTKLAEELGDDVSAKEILALSVSAKNELHAIKGYSPNQWAFGQNPERVWSFLNCYEHLPSMSSEEPTFHENIKRMAMAREVFIRCDSERRLQRVALLKSRKQQVFQSGDLVYYYRKGRGSGMVRRVFFLLRKPLNMLGEMWDPSFGFLMGSHFCDVHRNSCNMS